MRINEPLFQRQIGVVSTVSDARRRWRTYVRICTPGKFYGSMKLWLYYGLWHATLFGYSQPERKNKQRGSLLLFFWYGFSRADVREFFARASFAGFDVSTTMNL